MSYSSFTQNYIVPLYMAENGNTKVQHLSKCTHSITYYCIFEKIV